MVSASERAARVASSEMSSKKESKPDGSELNFGASWLFAIGIGVGMEMGGRVGKGVEWVLWEKPEKLE